MHRAARRRNPSRGLADSQEGNGCLASACSSYRWVSQRRSSPPASRRSSRVTPAPRTAGSPTASAPPTAAPISSPRMPDGTGVRQLTDRRRKPPLRRLLGGRQADRLLLRRQRVLGDLGDEAERDQAPPGDPPERLLDLPRLLAQRLEDRVHFVPGSPRAATRSTSSTRRTGCGLTQLTDCPGVGTFCINDFPVVVAERPPDRLHPRGAVRRRRQRARRAGLGDGRRRRQPARRSRPTPRSRTRSRTGALTARRSPTPPAPAASGS